MRYARTSLPSTWKRRSISETLASAAFDRESLMRSIFLYSQRLAEILKHQAALLQRIASDQRFYPGYFRVSFYGDFPAALKKQPFIVRKWNYHEYEEFANGNHTVPRV